MPSYPFLSDEWLDEARKIRAEYEGKTAPIPHVVRMNLVVTAVPFSDEDILAHMDTTSGELVLDTGHIENQDLKVVVDYETAKAILIEGNPQAGMQAFMAGKVRVEGDMAKLMALHGDARRRPTLLPPRWPLACATSPSSPRGCAFGPTLCPRSSAPILILRRPAAAHPAPPGASTG